MSAETVIDVHGLTKSFGKKTVVNNLDMTIRKGEIYGFLGPNGSGKTTSIRMLCGLLKPNSGSGSCLGYDIRTESDLIRPHVGYMTQKFSLYEDLTVRENLEFTAKVFALEAPAATVNECIDRMELGQFETSLQAHSQVGGNNASLSEPAHCILRNFCCSMNRQPGVDPGARRDFWDQVHTLASQGITALISTHYMDEAERCHRLAYIAYGNLLASGTSDEMIHDAQLTTWSVTSDQNETELHALSEQLRNLPGIDQVVAFGTTLHVSGRNPQRIKDSIKPFQTERFSWELIETSLEEVFIDLMQKSKAGLK